MQPGVGFFGRLAAKQIDNAEEHASGKGGEGLSKCVECFLEVIVETQLGDVVVDLARGVNEERTGVTGAPGPSLDGFQAGDEQRGPRLNQRDRLHGCTSKANLPLPLVV